MTTPLRLNVQKDELLARAAELEAPIPGMPSENPQAPCSLAMTVAAAQQLGLSADNMRIYLTVGHRESLRLAQSLRNAAAAFEDTEEAAEQALNSGTSVAAVTPAPVEEAFDPAMLPDTPVVAMTGGPEEYMDLTQRFFDFENGDQGAAFLAFADAWEAYERALLEAHYRFRPFEHWDGDASYAVEANFDSHRSWLNQMAAMCATMANDARGVAEAQRWSQSWHVGPPDKMIRHAQMVYLESQCRRVTDTKGRQMYMTMLAEVQRLSDDAMAEYIQRAALPLAPLNPATPPAAYKIEPPPEPEPDTDPGDGIGDDPYNGLPLDDEYLPDPTGMPGVPSAGMPTTPDDTAMLDALDDAWDDEPALLTGAGVSPASVGGGGVGRGTASIPLQPWGSPDGNSRPAAAASGREGLGRIPGAGAAMGGAGMGMAPMGGAPGAQGQGANKGKRAQRNDEPLYTEDRAWSGGIIGTKSRA